MNETDIITTTINLYNQTFAGYYHQFLNWGKWLFNGFSIITIVWLCLWNAFDSQPLAQTMAAFLKKFFIIAFFYTIMLNSTSWLSSIVETSQAMNQQLTHHLVDPASIIQQGLTIANKTLAPVKDSGIIHSGIGILLVTIAYAVILIAFIAVALNLAVTSLTTTFFISLSGLTIAFGSFQFSRNIALHTLEVIIGHSFKLLALYLVIDAGTSVFGKISNLLTHDKIPSFDVYAWSVAASLLFWMTAKIIPQLAKQLFNNCFQQLEVKGGL